MLLLCQMHMIIDTFYLHLEFKNKSGEWSINLPFLCIKCGVCCKLEDFLSAGEINAKSEEHPKVHTMVKALFEEIGKMWERDEAKYDKYIAHNPCPFLVNNACSIYELRPVGCRLFPKTTFGMLTEDCPALTIFKKQRSVLIKGRSHKETCHFTSSTKNEDIKSASITEKQFNICIAKLRQTGITNDELTLFTYFNEKTMSNKPKIRQNNQ